MARPEIYSPDILWRRQIIEALGGDALATNATAGFLYIPAMAGAPTGVPADQPGRAAIVVDSTNDKLCFYSNGAWHSVP